MVIVIVKVACNYDTYSSLWLCDKKYEDQYNAYRLIIEYGSYDEEYDIQIVVDENGREKNVSQKKLCDLFL